MSATPSSGHIVSDTCHARWVSLDIGGTRTFRADSFTEDSPKQGLNVLKKKPSMGFRSSAIKLPILKTHLNHDSVDLSEFPKRNVMLESAICVFSNRLTPI